MRSRFSSMDWYAWFVRIQAEFACYAIRCVCCCEPVDAASHLVRQSAFYTTTRPYPMNFEPSSKITSHVEANKAPKTTPYLPVAFAQLKSPKDNQRQHFLRGVSLTFDLGHIGIKADEDIDLVAFVMKFDTADFRVRTSPRTHDIAAPRHCDEAIVRQRVRCGRITVAIFESDDMFHGASISSRTPFALST